MSQTILETINELFNKNEDKNLTFQEIFKEVELTLGDYWKNNNPKQLSADQLIESKMGETYKLLTVDGRFIRLEDGTWLKRKINETK